MTVSTHPSQQLEAEEGLSLADAGVYPDAVVKISRDQYSLFEVKRMVEETKGLQLDPHFQRNKVWALAQKRELIESILMGIPIPVVYVFEDENGVKQIVDGRQRISTVIDFMNNQFALENLKMLPSFNGKKFKDLQPLYRSKLERYQISFYVIEPPTPERVKYDIFDRVNRGGTQLNNQEMRNALYGGLASQLIKNLSQSKAFKSATDNAVKSTRMRDQYIILRFIGFYLLRTHQLSFDFKSNIDEFLASVMKHINQLDEPSINTLKTIFITAMERSHKILGADGFRFSVAKLNRRPVNMALFEALTYLFALFDPSNWDADVLRVQIESLKSDFDQSDYFNNRVDSSVSVDYRFGTIERFAKGLTC